MPNTIQRSIKGMGICIFCAAAIAVFVRMIVTNLSRYSGALDDIIGLSSLGEEKKRIVTLILSVAMLGVIIIASVRAIRSAFRE